MGQVIIGVDPHKLSATIEVVDQQEKLLGAGRFSTDQAGYAAMRLYVKSWPDHLWAVEGANGAGRPLAQRLLEAGEHVVDVPAKLSARARLFDTGQNRKTDALDAHSIAMVAVRTEGLRVLKVDGELEALRMLADRREALTRRRVAVVNRLQALLAELLPGQAKKDITTGQAKALLASVRPRDIAGRTRRRIAAEELAELIAVEAKMKKATAELKVMVVARDSTLMDLHGVGPVVAARILADVGDIARFANRNRFASWTGTAPLDASSGEQNRHRLSRAGNRRMNHMIHIAAITQLRLDTDGRAYYRRKRTEGKKPMEALRCLKRRVSDAIYRQLVADAQRADDARLEAGPGGHCGASLLSSAAGLHPHTGTSDRPLPGPAPTTLPLTAPPRKPRPGPAPQHPRRRAGAVKVERPTGRTTLTATSAGAHSKEPIPTP
ncbi:IS110 family transposase [Ornithinimicrobium ciconiae]|uniref:IS110 family transposase n=1 Tax=Ornithinimicrobium ciconiae TaxID=2594265 RepID=A0A516GAB0_9MICO|nr:IS110 family transposase [Ornithinimicrobium ciconiae]QDO88463.1 IS110 family transposase [Ornithinimicrobium ciconiae]